MQHRPIQPAHQNTSYRPATAIEVIATTVFALLLAACVDAMQTHAAPVAMTSGAVTAATPTGLLADDPALHEAVDGSLPRY